MYNVHDNVSRFDLLKPGTYIAGTLVEDCEDAWNELAPTGCTITAGVTNKVVGTNAVKIAMTSAAAVGMIASEVITEADLSAAKYLSCYIMCTRGINAGDLQLCIDNTAECASPVKALDIPAIKSGVMNLVVLPLGDAAAGQDAIISVGLKMITDLGAYDVYIDQVLAHFDEPLIGEGVDVRPYFGQGKIVLSVAKVVAGTTKTLNVALQQSDDQYSGYAAFDPAKAFTEVEEEMGTEELKLDLDACKPWLRAVVTLGSADASYALALHGYGSLTRQ